LTADDELLMVFDSFGNPLEPKSRSEVHRDGDWHKLVFVWFARPQDKGRIRFLLQIRTREGDEYAGHVDALAGGHVVAGQSDLDNAIRECEEEVGLRLTPKEVVHLGSRKLENPGAACERVFQEYFLCTAPVAIDDLCFSDEAGGFVEVDLDEFSAMVEGKRNHIPALLRKKNDGGKSRMGEITSESLTGYSAGILESFRMSIALIRERVRGLSSSFGET
jgi:8-oxo-dGTP pyrophosphatase MutT (NUDIX family)